jgi:hypothetical protein
MRLQLPWSRTQPASTPPRILREFVYLDETSVYSLLASWLGAIPSEHVDKRSKSSTNRADVGLSGKSAGVPATVGLSRQLTTGEENQVVRKASVQSTFKLLLEELAPIMKPRPPQGAVPELAFADAVDDEVDRLVASGWLIDPDRLRRGDVLEIEVVLDAEPFFRVSSVMTQLMGLLESSPKLQADSAADLGEATEMTELIKSLMGELVPVRGRVLHYRYVNIADKQWLVHDAVVGQWPEEEQLGAEPVEVVGAAELPYFWKDLRQVLFSQKSYTVMCRLGRDGLQTSWSPIRLLDSLRGIAPDLAGEFDQFNDMLRAALDGADDAAPQVASTPPIVWMIDYVTVLAGQRDVAITSQDVAAAILAGELEVPVELSTDVEVFKPQFAALDKWLDGRGLPVDPGEAVAARTLVVAKNTDLYGSREGPDVLATSTVASATGAVRHLLDVEIVAMYW